MDSESSKPTDVGSNDQLGGMVPARLAAKPLDWEQDEDNQWSEKNPVRWGFYIVLEEDSEPPEYSAYWGESDGETCATLDEAKAWCQKTADDFIANAALVPPAPRQLVSVSSIDIEKMLAECVPGGQSCDPQQVADSIRRYCNAWPSA